jgi:MFS family permease
VQYAWVVVAVGFVALVMSAGFRSTAGVLLVPLHDEFGWSHETIGLAVSLNLLCFGLGAPFAAAFVERFGMRRVVSVALATIAFSSLLTLGMTEPWQLFLLWGVINGTATGAVSVPLAAIIANRWFVERRGLVTGVLTASNASGQLVFLPLLAWIAGFDCPPPPRSARRSRACASGCVRGRSGCWPGRSSSAARPRTGLSRRT